MGTPARLGLLAVLVLAVTASPVWADWTATGRFNYTDRPYDLTGFTGTSTRPVREADVIVMDLVTMATLASGATDANGDFSIAVTDASTRNVGVFALASATQTVTLNFSVVDNLAGNAAYSYNDAMTNVLMHGSSTNVNFGTMTMPLSVGPIASTDWSSQIFNMFDMSVLVADWIASVDGARPAVAYTTNWNPNNGRGGSFYNGGTNLLSISDDDAYDDANIVHEIGHYVEDEFGFSSNTGGSHFIGDDDQDPRLAWSEGFATLVSNASLGFGGRPRPDIYSDRDSFGVDGAGGGFAYQLESAVSGGATNEQAVNAALHDLVDSAATLDSSAGSDDDPLSGQDAGIWAVVERMRVQQPDATQMEDFWDIWFDLALGSLANMQTVFTAHSIDFVADAQEPNDTPATATTLAIGGAYQENTFYRSGAGVTGGDEDWFTFPATAGSYFRVELNGLNDTIYGRPDPEMFLLAPDLDTVLAHSDAPFDATLNTQSSSSAQDMDESVPQFLFQAAVTGNHYVVLRHGSHGINLLGRYGTYQVRVQSAGSPSPTVTTVSEQRMLPGQSYLALVIGTNFAVGATVTTSDASITATVEEWLHPTALIARLTPGTATPNGTPSLTVTNPGAGAAALMSAFEVSSAAQPPVAVSEVELGAPDLVEVRNLGTVAATLTNWQIVGRTTASTGGTFTFPAFALPAGGTVVVSENPGMDTATELFEPASPSFNWPWFANTTGDVSLIDDGGRNVDYFRFSSSVVTTHRAPLGTGGAWMQPEFLSPGLNAIVARAESTALYRTRTGLSRAMITMPAGAAGRQNAVDAFEDNDTPRRALVNGPTLSLSSLAISPRPTAEPTDEDWFGVVVEPGENVTFQAVFAHASGNLDMQLFAPGQESTALLSAASTTDNESLTLTAALSTANGGGVYRVRVFGAQNTYSLSASVAVDPAPTVTAITPVAGTTVGGTRVTITGTGFVAGATVSIGEAAATGVAVVTPATVTATTGARAAGTINVNVTNPDAQTGTLSNGFTYLTQSGSPFTDDPLIPGTTLIKTAHFLELRDRINEQLVRFSQPVQSFSNVIAAGVTMSAVDLTELYTAANTALAAAGQATISTPTITPMETAATAAHINALRAAVLTLEALP